MGPRPAEAISKIEMQMCNLQCRGGLEQADNGPKSGEGSLAPPLHKAKSSVAAETCPPQVSATLFLFHRPGRPCRRRCARPDRAARAIAPP